MSFCLKFLSVCLAIFSTLFLSGCDRPQPPEISVSSLQVDTPDLSKVAIPPNKVFHVQSKEALDILVHRAAVFIDLRTPEEWAGGVISSEAKLINFLGDDFETQVAALDQSKTYLIHCASGARSTRAIPAFQKAGHNPIYHLDGGYSAWKQAGLPTVEKK
ncbi:MAG: rhodanese-like domain-containing protein [Verrucomicrobiota bacterium]